MSQKSPSNKDGSKGLWIPAASAVCQAQESEQCELLILTERLPVQDSIPNTKFSTNQRPLKRFANPSTNECMPKRKRSFSPKLSPPCSPSADCKYTIKATPARHRMSAGHFSAWGTEDNEVLYYMQKDTGSDPQSEDPAAALTSHQEAPRSPQSSQNSGDNCANEKNRFTISPFRAIQTKNKQKHFATWMRSNSTTNPKTLFYTQFDERLVNTCKTSIPKDSDIIEEGISPTSEMWICDTCSFTNKGPSVKCRVCDVLKYGIITQNCERTLSNGNYCYQEFSVL
ncbi:uncharacterized protein LOC122548621 isoform X3 [Chiloscyllium plagiosum]|uniref:uncharacterized protein LOC122548621 isoform X2 n=1 Tax=Chiloscyllium plagiosum TaxID=36176 RepID=UPI001CB83A88|nr:uncharacterized protein LOC122548621 isoform X2 [Chiloscyllium plagiosum]XP_043543389.1 uncharacterized protein LOC122548621 isoform X3 [Chiloscyllium plagiosum]